MNKPENRMYQVSTLQALMMGYTRSVINVAELLQNGDIGLGTFEDVDGEMIVIDGQCYRASSNGDVVAAAPEKGVPFSSVCRLADTRSFELGSFTDIETLKSELNNRIEECFGLNSMHVARIDGEFEFVDARSESSYRAIHVTLKEMLSQTQTSFMFSGIKGSLVCVYYPDYMDGINAPGWHLHFISEDRSKGGHVFNVSMSSGSVVIGKINRIELRLPEEPGFDTYSLKNTANDDIKSVEQGKH